MNIERLTYIASWLEDGAPEHKGVAGFNMGDFEDITSCGTVCCIAGAAVYFFGDSRKGSMAQAEELLELDIDTADDLCSPLTDDAHYCVQNKDNPRFISAERAARVIRNLIATGTVDWSIR